MKYRTLLASVVTASALTVALSGCSVVSSLFPQGETRSDTGQITSGGTTDVFTLQEGDCLTDATVNQESVTTIPTTPCDQLHDSEVYANITMTESAFPGDTATADEADAQCTDAFAGFVGVALADSQYGYSYYVPSSDSWASGDRIINCTIYDPAGQIAGSLKGAGK